MNTDCAAAYENTVHSPIPLPEYECHKVVRAAEIIRIEGNALTLLIPGGPDCENATVKAIVTDEFLAKHKPQVGGYFVRYSDGYESWSPKTAFESGYTKK